MGGALDLQGSKPAASRPLTSPALNARNITGTNRSPASYRRESLGMLSALHHMAAFGHGAQESLGLDSKLVCTFKRLQLFSMRCSLQ